MKRVDYSTPGGSTVTIETLPDSARPAVLAKRYRLEEIEGGERILPVAVSPEDDHDADGTLGTLTPGSTQPTTMVTHHPGVHTTRRFSFNMP